MTHAAKRAVAGVAIVAALLLGWWSLASDGSPRSVVNAPEAALVPPVVPSKLRVDPARRPALTIGADPLEPPIEYRPRVCQLRIRLRSEEEIPSGILIDFMSQGRSLETGFNVADEVVVEKLPCAPIEAHLGGARGVIRTQTVSVEPSVEPAPWTEVWLAPPCAARVRAVDPEGRPVEGAWWVAHPAHDPTSVSAADGVVLVAACGNSWGAGWILADGFERRALGTLPEDEVLDVTLEPTEFFLVTAECPEAHAGQIRVAVWGPGGARPCSLEDDGRWLCEAPPIMPATVLVHGGEGFWSPPSGRVSVEDFARPVRVSCGTSVAYTPPERETGSSSIRVRVLGLDGSPAAGVTVQLSRQLDNPRPLETGPSGWTPWVREVPGGRWVGTASESELDRGIVSFDAQPGENEVELRMTDRAPCHGAVLARGESQPTMLVVAAGSPFWVAGLRPRDVLVSIDGASVAHQPTDEIQQQFWLEPGERREYVIDRMGADRLTLEAVCPP